MMSANRQFPFNGPLEVGVRAVSILSRAFPQAYDLQRLVAFDYLVVHTGDVGGPDSLHPDLPLRPAELLVRRELIQHGLYLMMSRGLVERVISASGISYMACEQAATFMKALDAPYHKSLRERSQWVVDTFGYVDDSVMRVKMRGLFGQWTDQFQVNPVEREGEA